MRESDPSMPVRLVAQRVDVNPARRSLARESLPPAAGVFVRDRDLEAVRREPACMVEIFVAIAAAATGAFHDNLATFQIAHDPVSPGIRWRRVFADVRNVPSVGGDEDILVRSPDVLG